MPNKTTGKKTHPLTFVKHFFVKKQKAFTLIEIMIAMAIIAILATAGIQAYNGYIKKGRDTARAEIAGDLNTAVMSYAASNGGKPPASAAAFDDFLASASQIFIATANAENGTLIQDPAGGNDVCLDAEGNATEPCAFHYTAYDDGTYAISYGVEHETSTEDNFYKTTNSVPDTDIPTNSIPKYGVYIGTAPYIGKPSTTQNIQVGYAYNPGEDNDGVDETYTPPGATNPVPLVVVYQSARIDSVSGSSGNTSGRGDACGVTTCNSGQGCQNNVCQEFCGSQLCTDVQECVNEACVDPSLCLGREIGELCSGGAMYAGSEYMVMPYHSFAGWSSALTYCANLESWGFTDWYLPNIDELSNVFYSNRVALGVTSDNYWSSTDVGPAYGYSLNDPNFSMIVWMYNGGLYNMGKNGGGAFRCIRGTGSDACGLCTATQQCVEGICEDLCGAGILCATGQLCIDNTCIDSCGGVMCTAEQQCTNEVCVDSCGGVFCTAEQQCTNEVCVDPDPCIQPGVSVGTVCADGTVYASASLRTTPSDTSSGSLWSTQNIVTGVTNLNNGESNTATLAALVGVYSAADTCANLVFPSPGGHDDWYLPARWELNVLYQSRDAIGGFGNAVSYWSSSEYSSTRAWRHYFAINAGGDDRAKSSAYRVRCVRTP